MRISATPDPDATLNTLTAVSESLGGKGHALGASERIARSP